MADQAAEAQGFKGCKNIYTCPACGHHIVTEDVDVGVTPMFVQCTAHGCAGTMRSSMYRVYDQAIRPTHEWYRPLIIAAQDFTPAVIEHVNKGGLLLRPKQTERHCRICFCRQNAACNPPCHWVEYDLCSACKAKLEREVLRQVAADQGVTIQ